MPRICECPLFRGFSTFQKKSLSLQQFNRGHQRVPCRYITSKNLWKMRRWPQLLLKQPWEKLEPCQTLPKFTEFTYLQLAVSAQFTKKIPPRVGYKTRWALVPKRLGYCDSKQTSIPYFNLSSYHPSKRLYIVDSWRQLSERRVWGWLIRLVGWSLQNK